MTAPVTTGPTASAPLVNWYLVEDGDRLTAVDAGLPGFAEDLEEELARSTASRPTSRR